jgi:hypothetical protein
MRTTFSFVNVFNGFVSFFSPVRLKAQIGRFCHFMAENPFVTLWFNPKAEKTTDRTKRLNHSS